MSRAVEQRHNVEGIVKPGELVEIRQGASLTLQDRRILNVLLENAGPGITEDEDHRIAMRRLRGPTHKGGERVKDSILRLMGTIIEVPTLDRHGNKATRRMTLLSDTCTTDDEDNPTGEVVYSFSKRMREVIKQSRYWGRVKSHVMFAFTSKYSLTLYEAVCLRANLRKSAHTFSIEEFRQLLGVADGKLERFADFNKYALKPAVEEVNALSDFRVTVDAEREGGIVRGRITGYLVTWERKGPDEWRNTFDELMRPKVGRRARIRGKVEAVA